MTQPEVALLGVGPWGRNHLRVLQELGALRTVFDVDSRRLQESVPEALRADSFASILGDSGVRAVVIATPARTHYELARAALEAGKDVLVEKPLTLVEREGRHLVELASERDARLMVGHITLYHPAIETLVALVREGELGAVRYLYSNRLNLGTVREEEDILWSFAPHDIAVMLELLGTWPERVVSQGGSYLREGRADVTVTHLEFPRGIRAHIFVSWLHPMKEHRLVVIGDRKMAAFTDDGASGSLMLYDVGVDLVEEIAVHRRNGGVPVSFPEREPLRAELEHFLAVVARREACRSGGRHGLEVLRVLETAQASLESRGEPLACPTVQGVVS